MKKKNNHNLLNTRPSKTVTVNLGIDLKFKLALSLHQQQRLQEAKVLYESILTANPSHAETSHLLGMLISQMGNQERAIELISNAINLDPDNSNYYNNRGLIFQKLTLYKDALNDFEKSILLDSKLAQAHCNMGNTFQELQKFNDALACFNTAISLQPDYADAYFNRGNLHIILQNIKNAIEDFDQALRLFPGDADYMYNKSIALLLDGQYEMGWKLYESRWDRQATLHHRRQFSTPLWLGQHSIRFKSILIYAEQGLGDSIQFIRYIPMLVELGAVVFIEIQPPLFELFQSITGVSKWIKKGDQLPSFDFHCPLMSLPLAFKTKLENIPFSKNYLVTDKTKVSFWENKLGYKKRPRIGIAWSGSSIHKNDHNRSISLAAFSLMLCEDVDFYSLHKDYRAHDVEFLSKHPKIIDYSYELSDFSDTASLIELMDLIITVDTSIAHVSGALGKLTWVLLPHDCDFRWLLHREDSPWYESVKLFRQKSYRNWEQTLLDVGLKLKNFIADL